MQKELLSEILKLVRNQPKGDPEFRPESWENFLDAGCYSYALDIHYDKYFLLGDFIGKRCNEDVTNEILLETFYQEMNFFNYKVHQIDDTENYLCNINQKKIYIQRLEFTGYYHFLREDSDGLWSHKFPWQYPIRKDTDGNIIEDPSCMVDVPFTGWCFVLEKTN